MSKINNNAHSHRVRVISRLTGILKSRFAKFSLVGMTGVPVNIGTLYISKEFIFSSIQGKIFGMDLGLNLSLFTAIFCSIMNNFIWNNKWTWKDRRLKNKSSHYFIRFLQYLFASWVGIIIQIIITNALTNDGVYYLISNITAIIVASVFNFIINDRWTFRQI